MFVLAFYAQTEDFDAHGHDYTPITFRSKSGISCTVNVRVEDVTNFTSGTDPHDYAIDNTETWETFLNTVTFE
jgi:hypothetical protein